MTMYGAASSEAVAAARHAEGMSEHDRLKVYYDGACPLCAREIGFYRRQEGTDRSYWIDISGLEFVDVAPDLTRDKALARFTVRDIDGSLVSGGKAFTRLCKQLSRFLRLAMLFEFAPFAWPLDRAYEIFLTLRPHLQAMVATKSIGAPRG